MADTIWVDVEDLFEYAEHNPRPSGIQRLAFELCGALQQQYGQTGRVRFVRHDPLRLSLRVVPWASVARLFDRLTDAEDPPPALASPPPASGIAPDAALRRGIKRLVYRLPSELRQSSIRFARLQGQAFGAFSDVVVALWRGMAVRPRRSFRARPAMAPAGRETPDGEPGPDDFASLAAPGDMVTVLGAPWFHPDYGRLITTLRARHGMRFALLVYDIIPLRHPEWCDRGLVRIFRAWFAAVLPLADTVFAISRATAEDLEAYAREAGIKLRGEVRRIPIGTGFGVAAAAAHAARPGAVLSARLPAAGSYALIVSTIEARKNHALLFRIWRRLLRDLPREQVPTLVFAGRIGWLVSDLMQQLANTDWLDGRIRLVENPTDAELEALYRGCLFTLFPSLYEGWGLPVTESLAFGKPCVIADRTSLPEAGGSLARYFDPENIDDAYRVVRATIEDREGLAAWEAVVRRDFRPVPWSEAAEVIMASSSATPACRPPDTALG